MHKLYIRCAIGFIRTYIQKDKDDINTSKLNINNLGLIYLEFQLFLFNTEFLRIENILENKNKYFYLHSTYRKVYNVS